MADLNKLFSDFNEKITLSSSKNDNLRTGRDALREKIKNKFNDKDRTKPNFCGQGSFMMRTTVNPLGDREYDLDDGVYLNGYSDKETDEWPKTSTVHTWIKDAVDGHTSTQPVDKNTCVRVIYVNDYHIDLPSYIIKDEIAYLAHKDKGWIESDPKAFTNWFKDKVKDEGEQLRNLVKYLKAWKENKNVSLKGIEITILVGENFYPSDKRDDAALLGTLTNIIQTLEDEFKCVKPVIPNENLFDGFSETKKKGIINALKKLKSNVEKAINEEDEEQASNYMIDSFGNRFPKGKKSTSSETKSQFISMAAPAVLKNDGRSS